MNQARDDVISEYILQIIQTCVFRPEINCLQCLNN